MKQARPATVNHALSCGRTNYLQPDGQTMNGAHNTTNLEPLQVTAFILTSTLSGALFAEETVRPNVVVITTDDMGFSDIGCYGGETAYPDQPFFLCLAYNAPHSPIQAPAGEVAKYRGKYRQGWDAIRKDRFARQKTRGLAGRNWRFPKRPNGIPAWDTLDANSQDFEDLRMATYAAMVDCVDLRNTARKSRAGVARTYTLLRALQQPGRRRSGLAPGHGLQRALAASIALGCSASADAALRSQVTGPNTKGLSR